MCERKAGMDGQAGAGGSSLPCGRTRNMATLCYSAPQGPSGSIAAASCPRCQRLAVAASVHCAMARPLLHICPPSVCPAEELAARWIAAVCQSDAAPFAPSPLSRIARAGTEAIHSQAEPVACTCHCSHCRALWYDTCTALLRRRRGSISRAAAQVEYVSIRRA
jgi:hypothetical protein